MSRNKEHRGVAFGGALNGAAAFGGRPIGSVFLCVQAANHMFISMSAILWTPMMKHRILCIGIHSRGKKDG